jgi:type IX secretion system PorP/SprF family membrane protein
VFVGVSADQLTGDMVEFGSGTAFFDRQIHMMLTGGVKIPMGDNLELTPAVLVKFMNPAPLAIEGSLQLEYKQRYWFGASYRHQDAVVGMVGMNISTRFKFGYSFDFSINRYNTYKSGGHELVLGIMLGRNRPGANPPASTSGSTTITPTTF